MTGQRLGVYDVQALLGAGGMGEVYRARDTRLGRDVAVKVLPAVFTADPERLARFEREARMLAALNHPHIAAIHGIEESGGVTALVLELVEGETLAERIGRYVGQRRRGLPLDGMLAIARQIAEALEAAHEKGIIHRDLKPANIKITPDDTVKVLDFGVAKAIEGDVAGADTGVSTAVLGATGAGLVVGTAAYMSPEQARGLPVDKRTDIWAYGCVCFEMLSGRPGFSGATLSDIIAAVLEREPAWDALPEETPPALGGLIRRCLVKDARRRLRDIGDARLELEELLERPAQGVTSALRPTAVNRRTAIAALMGAAAGAAVTGLVDMSRRPVTSPRRLMRFALPLPEGSIVPSSHLRRVAIAPDGSAIAAYVLQPQGALLVRSLRDLEFRPAGEGAIIGSPFFSPDNRWLGYLTVLDGQWLRKVALTGGAPVTITSYADSQPAGATWAAEDIIYFVSATPGALMRVSANGGEQEEVARIDFESGERLHKWPHALPGGAGVLFTVATSDSESFDDTHIAVVSTRTGQRRMLVEGGTAPCFSPSGHIVYARGGKLLAVGFDPERLEITGQPFTVLEGVMMSRNNGVANFDISTSGDLVYVPGKADGGARHLFWVDRNGNAEKLPLPARSYVRPRLSPDGRKVAIEIEGSNHDIHVFDFANGVLSNVTTDGVSHWPVWSPDGTRIGYRSGPMGRFKLWHVPRTGAARRSRSARTARGRVSSRFLRTAVRSRTRPGPAAEGGRRSRSCRWTAADRHGRSMTASTHRAPRNSPLTGDGSHTARTNRASRRCTSRPFRDPVRRFRSRTRAAPIRCGGEPAASCSTETGIA